MTHVSLQSHGLFNLFSSEPHSVEFFQCAGSHQQKLISEARAGIYVAAFRTNDDAVWFCESRWSVQPIFLASDREKQQMFLQLWEKKIYLKAQFSRVVEKKKRIHPLMHPSSVLLSVYHRVVLDRWTYVEIINHAALMVTQESSIAGKSVVEEHRKRMESRQTVSTLKY